MGQISSVAAWLLSSEGGGVVAHSCAIFLFNLGGEI